MRRIFPDRKGLSPPESRRPEADTSGEGRRIPSGKPGAKPPLPRRRRQIPTRCSSPESPCGRTFPEAPNPGASAAPRHSPAPSDKQRCPPSGCGKAPGSENPGGWPRRRDRQISAPGILRQTSKGRRPRSRFPPRSDSAGGSSRRQKSPRSIPPDPRRPDARASAAGLPECRWGS